MTLSRLLHHMMDAESPHAKEEKLRVCFSITPATPGRSSDFQTFVRAACILFRRDSPAGGFVQGTD